MSPDEAGGNGGYRSRCAAARTAMSDTQTVASPDAAPRYRAMQRAGRARLLAAIVEDSTTHELIEVASAAMASTLAELLNAETAGEPLPTAGEQHRPSRFHVAHSPSGLSSSVSVVYVHGAKSRVVARAQSDGAAGAVARLLNHVNYPMIEDPSWLAPVPAPGVIGREPDLPMACRRSGSKRLLSGRAAIYLVSSLIPAAAVVALLIVVAWPYVVASAVVFAVIAFAVVHGR